MEISAVPPFATMKFLAVTLALLFAGASARTTWRELDGYSFESYVTEFGKNYAADSEEWSFRAVLFAERLEAVRAHNADASKTYKMGVNQFTDGTAEEFKAAKGYAGTSHAATADAATVAAAARGAVVPDSLDWREKDVVTPVKNQGGCGR